TGKSFSGLDDLRQDVRLTQDQQVLAVDLELRPAVLRVQDLVALADVERDPLLAVLVPVAVTDREDLALLGLLLGRVRQDDAARRRLLLFNRLHDQPIAERLQVHTCYLRSGVFKRDKASAISAGR